MRILIATPLYPPDIAPSAPYVKELALRLSKHHAVTVLAYGHIPEIIPDVSIITVSKRAPLPVRILRFAKALLQNAHNADILIIENGPSVEVPFLLTGPFVRRKKIFSISDIVAKAHAQDSFLHGATLSLARHFAHETMGTDVFPLPRPEIHPFKQYPHEAFNAYEASWEKHRALIESHCV